MVSILILAVLSAVLFLYLFSDSAPDGFRLKKYREHSLLNRSYLLLLTMLVSAVLVSAMLAVWFHQPENTTAGYMLQTLNVLGFKSGDDSWGVMFEALNRLRADPQNPVSLFERVFFTDKIKFQYPLSSLLLVDFPQRVFSADWSSVSIVLNRLSWIGLIAMGFMIYYLLFDTASRYGEQGVRSGLDSRKQFRFPLLLISFASVFLFYPLTRSCYLGQIQTLLTCLTAAALIAWSKDRKILAGFLIGLCCSIKPQYAVVLLWAAFRKEWKFSVFLLVTAGLLQVVSVLEYGFNNVVGYLDVLRFISRRGESFFPNQSVNGVMNRLLFNGNNLEWLEDSFPAYNPAVYYTTLVSSVIILGFALLWRVRQKPQLLDLALIFLSVTIASPVAWEHHYGIVLPIFAVLIPAAIARRPFGKWTEAYLLVSYFLVSQKLDSFTDQFANTYLNFLQSYLFFGAAMVLVLLYRLLSVETKIAKTSA
ncbi:DUF2029 domain-containing protein [Chlorobaculum sp. 24CR]|uniref:glycosyltransferase family 87 protein n=1 Tax=Chlorobaculum sp. 24CR TaxID=2508878 RepID=UPI001025CADD|nr:glycosyltransferase family 87 protein [Chlorobaculum sp. 24CR]RXK88711.1 DUF2029 domain-containing protein [Chlorobaculum sp. 24CR]